MAATVKARDRWFITVWPGSSMHYCSSMMWRRITWSGGPNIPPITFTMREKRTQRAISRTENWQPNAATER
jgi:hypothetical protein